MLTTLAFASSSFKNAVKLSLYIPTPIAPIVILLLGATELFNLIDSAFIMQGAETRVTAAQEDF